MYAWRKNLEVYDPNKKTFKDMRKKMAYAVFSYFTHEGWEYRRSFWAEKGTTEQQFWEIAPTKIKVG